MFCFKDVTYDPFFAELIEIDDDDTLTVNFNMKRITNFTNSVSGQVFDSTNTINIDKGIIIVRTVHTFLLRYQKETNFLQIH